MRTVLVGAVASTERALRAMLDAGFAPAAVMTLPLERAGRHSDFVDLRPLASAGGVPLIEAADVNDQEVLARLSGVAPDYAFVIGWSQLCRREFLAVARRGSVGFHPAPLPRNRGRAVIPWTILQGVSETGSTLFWMDEGMDSGDVLGQERFPVAPDETAASLYARHLDALERLLRDALPRLAVGDEPRTAQDHSRATWCARRTPEDGLIDWRAPAREVWTLIRASGRPYPGAFCFSRGRRLVVWEAALAGAGPYWGLAGQVQRIDGRGALVQCGDREHVLLREVQVQGNDPAPAAGVLRMHEQLGVDRAGLIQRVAGETAW